LANPDQDENWSVPGKGEENSQPKATQAFRTLKAEPQNPGKEICKKSHRYVDILMSNTRVSKKKYIAT
jgi:hypothetical protein